MNKNTKNLLLLISMCMLVFNIIGQELISDRHFQNGTRVLSPLGTYQGDLQPLSNSPTDADGNVYSSVQIGNNTWITENFKSTKFNDGSSITVKYHSGDPAPHIYGPSYSWNDIVKPMFSPVGWHAATDVEWRALFNYVGGDGNAGGSGLKLKEVGTTHWNTANGTNDTGFTAFGSAHIYGAALKEEGTWWAAAESSAANGLRWSIFDTGAMWTGNNDKTMFFPVRLVKNKPNGWSLGQWNSSSSIINATPTIATDGWYSWADTNKEVQMGPHGVRDYDLLLGVDGKAEFGGTYRGANDPWPALIIQQAISAPGFQGPGGLPLDQISNLKFHIEAKLGNDAQNIGPGYDSNIHAAHYQVFFTIQNLNQASSGYGDYMWFGIPIYDDRYDSPALVVMVDQGTGKLMYIIPYQDVATVSTHTKQWVNFDADIYPYVKAALQEAWSRGILSDSHNLADYKIGSMNMGWEVTGLNQVDIKTRNLSLIENDTGTLGIKNYTQTEKYFKLKQNYPNPALGNTTIKYIISKAGKVKLIIYDYLGKKIGTLVNEFDDEGIYLIPFNVEKYPSGIYFCKLSMGNLYQTIKIQVSR